MAEQKQPYVYQHYPLWVQKDGKKFVVQHEAEHRERVPEDFAKAKPAKPTELVVETKEYTDGTTATGVAPLPDQSPAQQDAAKKPRKVRKAKPAAEPPAE